VAVERRDREQRENVADTCLTGLVTSVTGSTEAEVDVDAADDFNDLITGQRDRKGRQGHFGDLGY
jgi:hypothetical protein